MIRFDRIMKIKGKHYRLFFCTSYTPGTDIFGLLNFELIPREPCNCGAFTYTNMMKEGKKILSCNICDGDDDCVLNPLEI